MEQEVDMGAAGHSIVQLFVLRSAREEDQRTVELTWKLQQAV